VSPPAAVGVTAASPTTPISDRTSSPVLPLPLRLRLAIADGAPSCGMDKPANVLQRHSDMDDIINLTALTVVEAQQR